MYKSTNSSLNIKQKAKVKSKCTEYLTDRTFFDKTNDQYELEQLVKHFFSLPMYFIEEYAALLCKVQKNTENLNSRVFKTKNGTLITQSKRAGCGTKKSRFVKD